MLTLLDSLLLNNDKKDDKKAFDSWLLNPLAPTPEDATIDEISMHTVSQVKSVIANESNLNQRIVAGKTCQEESA